MLKPEPRSVRTLLSRYACARIALMEKADPAWQREMEDVTYTLCVVTGTQSITDAIAAADQILAAAERPDPRPDVRPDARPAGPEGQDTLLVA
ncbi:DUF5133 domain-containing protein [Streptomyces sp. G44]|uniref:DUF5133 domain-containing protein n=1 Tax=Streptomyces sp. G44 TaxID=2807632 RepID=UPI0019612C03|nr:DUF5133 domain-containing protein [Streptomyces sp. G44]MBM7173226.1 DUF5133 domain-containing protein [Streptomyces sp. G44]